LRRLLFIAVVLGELRPQTPITTKV